MIRRLLRDTRGATAMEYGLLAALVVIGVMAAIQNLGEQTGDTWDDISAKMHDSSAKVR